MHLNISLVGSNFYAHIYMNFYVCLVAAGTTTEKQNYMYCMYCPATKLMVQLLSKLPLYSKFVTTWGERISHDYLYCKHSI